MSSSSSYQQYGYLMTRRIERAKWCLLRRGDLSVTEVCFKGVAAPSLGARCSTRFTELVGVPPSACTSGKRDPCDRGSRLRRGG